MIRVRIFASTGQGTVEVEEEIPVEWNWSTDSTAAEIKRLADRAVERALAAVRASEDSS